MANDTSTHDVGFMVFDSFGLGATLGGKREEYTPIIQTAAGSLAKRCVFRAWAELWRAFACGVG